MVAKTYLEPLVEPIFHPDSYAYRPGKSHLQAVGKARERCWRYNWVVDLDIKACFDSLDHDLIMKAVRHHTDCPWLLLYIERWLKAPVQMADGSLVHPEKGTPQGGVISPLLMNLFLHYAFDEWMKREFPQIPFERFADDIVAHCKSERQATWLRQAIKERLAQCRLEVHPEKTKIVYCKDDDRTEGYPIQKFDFLGYTFQPRRAKNKFGKYFVTFSPAMSIKAATMVRQIMRSWGLQNRSDKSLEDISRMFNPILHGWLNYYSKYRKSGVYSVFRHFNRILGRWATRKYKRLKRHRRRAEHWLGRIAKKEPHLFAHWHRLQLLPSVGQ